jgi:hypothetical protein
MHTDGGEWVASGLHALGTHWKGDRVGHRAGVDIV